MKITYAGRQQLNIPIFLRKVGYHPIVDRRSSQDSWVRNMGRSHYPRFHLYVKHEKSGKLQFNLNLDQKKNTIKLKCIKRTIEVLNARDCLRMRPEFMVRSQTYFEVINLGALVRGVGVTV